MKIFIPSRLGSKGIPFKNRILFDYTYNIIPEQHKKDIIVSTDDPDIITKCQGLNIDYIERTEILSNDTASMKDVLLDYNNKRLPDEPILLLYLTYPNRKWDDVLKAYDFYLINKANSLLCRKDVKTNPYLCMYMLDGIHGEPIIKHNLYRRQDYLPTFEISHYIGIFNPSEINNLNLNLYNKQTVFFPIKDTIDVDLPSDLEKFFNN